MTVVVVGPPVVEAAVVVVAVVVVAAVVVAGQGASYGIRFRIPYLQPLQTVIEGLREQATLQQLAHLYHPIPPRNPG